MRGTNMEINIKRLLVVGTATLLLGACTNTNDEEVPKDTVQAEPESVEEVINVDDGYFVDQIKTTLSIKTTPLPDLTEEELELATEITSKVSEASTPTPGEEPLFLSDRGFIETFADEYPEYTVDELLELHYDGSDYRMYKEFEDVYIHPNDLHIAIESIMGANIRPELDFKSWQNNGGTYDFNNDYTEATFVGNYKYDGKALPVKVKVGFDNGDYSTGTLTQLTIDGEDAIE